jgi:hypothetical protein
MVGNRDNFFSWLSFYKETDAYVCCTLRSPWLWVHLCMNLVHWKPVLGEHLLHADWLVPIHGPGTALIRNCLLCASTNALTLSSFAYHLVSHTFNPLPHPIITSKLAANTSHQYLTPLVCESSEEGSSTPAPVVIGLTSSWNAGARTLTRPFLWLRTV